MTVLPHQDVPTSILVTGPDATVRSAIARLLSLESGVRVVGTAPSLEQATVDADVVVDDTLLHDLRSVPIGDFIDMIKNLPPAAIPLRHLQAVPATRDIRTALSEREFEVVRLVAEGLSNKQISIRLKLSDKTVKNHISHILAKLNLSARTQVAVHALRAGLV